MKTILNFAKKNIKWIIAAVLYVGSWVLVCFNPVMTLWHWLIFISAQVLGILPFACGIDETISRRHAALITSIELIIIGLMWLLPISLLWVFVPIWLTGLYLKLLWFPHTCVTVMFLGVIMLGMLFDDIANRKKQYLENTPPETVVISVIDKSDRDNILVTLEDRRILPFSGYLGQDLLCAGDTINIVVYQGEIIKIAR